MRQRVKGESRLIRQKNYANQPSHYISAEGGDDDDHHRHRYN